MRREGGYTVTEMVVVMAILGVVLAGFAQMLMTSSKTSDRVTEQALLQNEVRVAVDRLTTDLRSATNANGTSPVESATATSITFLAPDTTTPFHLRRISYRMTNGLLDRSVTYSTDTDGWPWIWPATPGTYVNQLGSITNSTLFTYYDDGGAVTTDPAAVKSVRVNVTVAPKKNQGGSAAYSALITIRTLQ